MYRDLFSFYLVVICFHRLDTIAFSVVKYQRYDMQNEAKGSIGFIVLTLKPRLCAFLNKGIFDSGLNSNNSYSKTVKV